ncbi:MAG: hypothetical protein M3082_06640 [Candidatus Dormibacteraeota bacterium]|nr:hypothetical protein [Candidatus Dormibacteraeota bacterium]
MNDLTQMLGKLSPDLANVVQQVQAGDHAAVPDNQAHAAYNQVAAPLSVDEFQQVAAKAYAQFSPEQRSQIAGYLRTQAQQHGITLPNLPSASAAAGDPGALADATAQVHAQDPNLLQQLFAPGGIFSNPIAKAALLGITAMAAQRLAGRR